MGELTIIKEAKGDKVASITADRRLYLTADRAKVVEAGDSAAAYLLAGEGSEISAAEAKRLGLAVRAGKIVLEGAEPVAPPAPAGPAPEPKPKPQRKRRSKKKGG